MGRAAVRAVRRGPADHRGAGPAALVPESGAALRRWHADHLDPRAPAAAHITSSLLATATVATSEREAYLAFTLDARRAGSPIRAAGGGPAGAAAVLARGVRALTSAVASADLHIESWLASHDLAEVLRTAFDPDSAAGIAERRAAESRPGQYVHDGAVSVAYRR